MTLQVYVYNLLTCQLLFLIVVGCVCMSVATCVAADCWTVDIKGGTFLLLGAH